MPTYLRVIRGGQARPPASGRWWRLAVRRPGVTVALGVMLLALFWLWHGR